MNFAGTPRSWNNRQPKPSIAAYREKTRGSDAKGKPAEADPKASRCSTPSASRSCASAWTISRVFIAEVVAFATRRRSRSASRK